MDNVHPLHCGYNASMMQKLRDYFRSNEIREGRPFYAVITLLLVSAGLTMLDEANAFSLGRIVLFVALMLVHVALHWLSGSTVDRERWFVGYLGLQGLLAMAIIFVSQSPSLVLALFGSLIGESLGLIGLRPVAVRSTLVFLTLTLLAYYALGGIGLVTDWAWPVIFTMGLIIIFMILYRRQSEAREHSQALLVELETAHHQLADYTTQVENLTLAAERQRMARELHDTLAQGVAGLILQLEATLAHLENGRIVRAQAIIEQSMKRARNTLAESRAAIDDLRHENNTLADIINYHTQRFTQATGIPCHLDLDIDPAKSVSSTISDHAERILSESFANITRHAQANNVWLRMTQVDDVLTIDLRDDGVGFDIETAVRAGHYGLLGLRERARLLHGSCEIFSKPKQGTRLYVTLPLEAA